MTDNYEKAKYYYEKALMDFRKDQDTLLIVKCLVNLMGGEIYVSSRLGEGSIFSFSVELGKIPATPDSQSPELIGPQTQPKN